MSENTEILSVLEGRAKRREGRRDFFRMMGAAAALPAVVLTLNAGI